MMQSLVAFALIRVLLLPCPAVSLWRIERGGTITDSAYRQRWDLERRTPPNTADPDYFHPASRGGRPQHPGSDGAVVFVALVHAANPTTRFETVDVPPLELRAQYFVRENVAQTYVVPGDPYGRPYEQEVRVKVWGGGGGGCDGGRGETELSTPEEDDEGGDIVKFGEGSGGGYVEAAFVLPVGDALQIVVGGGGMSEGSLPDSLGGEGGYNGGLPGRSDETSGGGGGGGLTTVSWNGTVIAAAYGGDGGGNTTYCTALGGVGASLRGRPRDAGGYINFDLALPNADGDSEELICPGEPATTMLSHDSAEFTWDAGSRRNDRSKEFYVQRYTVQLSEQGDDLVDVEDPTKGLIPPCSGDFELHEHIQRHYDVTRNATTEVTGLRASTSHCIRIEAFSIEGLSLGVQLLPFATRATPVNRWLPVTVREPRVSTISEVENAAETIDDDGSGAASAASSWCQHSVGLPTGRRGHSMTIINDQVYIFGGATLKCVCEPANDNDRATLQAEGEKQRRCTSKNVYSNELWHFDPLTSMFTQLRRGTGSDDGEGEPWPRGREQHSATALPNGDIIIIGGLSAPAGDSDDDVDGDLEIARDDSAEGGLLADVWRMRDPHHISSHVIRGGSSGNRSAMDDEMPLPLELVPGHITSHRLSAYIHDDDEGEEAGEDQRMCIHDIQVKVFLDHSCLKGIEYIKLTGPGTKDATDHDAPQSEEYATKMFVSSMDSREMECQGSPSLKLHFSDDAEESVLSNASIPTSGAPFRPASSVMSTFGGLPIDGEWEISIALSQPTHPEEQHHLSGHLLDWELEVDAKPCVARAKWEKLWPATSSSSTSTFSPRRLHTTVAVDNSIFVAGGFAERRLTDLWRFDYDSNAWTELNGSSASRVGGKSWPLNGQTAFLGQFGLLAFGGKAKTTNALEQGRDLWLLDLFGDNDWVPVPIPQSASAHDDDDGDRHHFNNDIPYVRYLSSIGFLNNVGTICKRYDFDEDGEVCPPMALVFGGDGGLLHNTYADSYGFVPNSFFNDVWLLSPGGVDVSVRSMNQRRREQYCNWRFLKSSTSFQSWNDSCGWDASSPDDPPRECRFEHILIAAWCREQYQSLWMS